jgi:zinc/manganese transport system substrate-binding protein
MKITTTFVALLLAILAAPVRADLRVFSCEPTWSALATALGGDKVTAESATTAFQDPHFLQAKPSLISKVRRADLVICTGADLEVGWLPLLLRQAGNRSAQPGQAGYMSAADYVDLLEKPATVDRALGDIHPYGNPHVQTDPRNIAKVAAALAERLESLDAANADYYKARYADFASRWQTAVERWTKQLEPVKGMQVITHHHAWVYLERWAGLEEVGNLEPKPGLPPSAAHLAELLEQLAQQHVKLIVRAAYQDPKASEWLSGRANIPAAIVPDTVGSVPGTDDLFGLFDVIVKTLLEANS